MPVRRSTLKSLFAILILVLATAGPAAAKGGKGAKNAGKTRITTSCKPCQPTADKLGAKIDEQKALAKRAKELEEEAERIYRHRVTPLREEVWHLEEKVKKLGKQITAQEKILRDLRVKLSKTSRIRAHVNGLNQKVAAANRKLHELKNELIRTQSVIPDARGRYKRAERQEQRTRDWARKTKRQAELVQGEVDGLRRALSECEKQCKGKSAGGTSGSVGGGAGSTPVPGGKASTRCLPCDGTAKAINKAMEDLRSLRGKRAEAERKRKAADAESGRISRDIKAIEAGGTKAARDEQRNLGGLRKSLERAHKAWSDAGAEGRRLDREIEKKKAELGGLLLHLSECEKKCKIGTKTSWVDPSTPSNQALAHSSAAAFGAGRERTRTLPPAAYYGGTGPTAGDAMASGFGLALGMAGSVPVSVDEPEAAAAPVDDPVAANPCDSGREAY